MFCCVKLLLDYSRKVGPVFHPVFQNPLQRYKKFLIYANIFEDFFTNGLEF